MIINVEPSATIQGAFDIKLNGLIVAMTRSLNDPVAAYLNADATAWAIERQCMGVPLAPVQWRW